ncbi:MAG: DUF6249 domain-containing protein [Bacteroidota bacterium]
MNTLLILGDLTTSLISTRQEVFGTNNNFIPDKYFEIIIVILVGWIAAAIIMSFVKALLDNRLKYKMIEKGVTEETIQQVLSPDRTEAKHSSFKWFLLLMGISLGIFISSVFQFGTISIGIILFTTSISFFIYHIYLKRTINK